MSRKTDMKQDDEASAEKPLEMAPLWSENLFTLHINILPNLTKTK